jgi:hypothetical protein
MDLFRPLGTVVRDHREPEPELGEADRGAVPVNAEEIPLEDAPPRRGCRAVAGVKRGESVERAEKEGAGPHGRVEDSEPADGPPGRILSIGETPLRLSEGACETLGYQGGEPLTQ